MGKTKVKPSKPTISLPTDQQDLFPFQTHLSLQSLIKFWDSQSQGKNPVMAGMAKSLLDKVSLIPELNESVIDPEFALKHQDLIDSLVSALFPIGTLDTEISGAAIPYQHQNIYASPKLMRMREEKEILGQKMEQDELIAMRYRQAIHAYLFILKKVYNVKVSSGQTVTFRLPDPVDGLDRYFQGNFENTFVEVDITGEAPRLSKAEIRMIHENPDDLDMLRGILPPELFTLRGLSIIRLNEVSHEQLTSKLKVQLLETTAITDPDKFAQIEFDVKSLLGLPQLKIGISSFEWKKMGLDRLAHNLPPSFMMKLSQNVSCGADKLGVYSRVFEMNQPVVIEDLDMLLGKSSREESSMEEAIRSEGIRSLILAPLRINGALSGVLELVSTNPGDLNFDILRKIDDVLPMFSVAMQREEEALQNRIQAIIKEECTAIHPSVEWRFNQAALKVVEKQNKKSSTRMEPIVFDEIYPLYAASDVRGSSDIRNQAIQADLIESLEGANLIIEDIRKLFPMPILRNMAFRLDQLIERIGEGLASSDESYVVQLLREEVKPLMAHFQSKDPGIKSKVEAYCDGIDDKLGLVYRRRKAFEDSITHLNETISAFLDQRNADAQSSHPHYFEKFKSDGVEYNIYVGESLREQKDFTMMHLQNLRLWQLLTTCEIGRISQAMKEHLPVPLDATHLILVHSTPLSIRFRVEEKKFDVDGAYNIRYEIVKKRIDKAVIRHTGERLTQPGKIAIVYSSEKDAEEYRKYFAFLLAEGQIESEVEDFELESLPGVKGLRALRVTIA